MNAVMLWKEYRQQRSTWIAVTILAVLLVEALLYIGGTATMPLFGVSGVQVAPVIVMIGTIIAYGIISGAQLFATEKEEGTLDFLDNLTGRRRPLWRSKLCAGLLLTLSQCLVMAGYFIARGIGVWQVTVLMPPLILIGFAWGLLGGVLCRHALTAILTGMALMAASSALLYPVLFYPLDSSWSRGSQLLWPLWNIPIELGTSLAATLLARQILCRTDRQRAPASQERSNPRRLPFLWSWQVVCWLVYRQGRWLFFGLVAAAFALAIVANRAPLVAWPIGTTLLGLACGLAVFCPDQHSGRLFWGAQGFSRARVWYVKILVWVAVLVVVVTLTWCVLTAQASLDPFRPIAALDHWQGPAFDEPGRRLDSVLFLALWPAQAFCVGVFLGQVMRRPVLALIWGVIVAPMVAAFWLPSFLIGGLPVWQVLVVPLILLLTSLLMQCPWISDRLWNAKSIVRIALAVFLMVGWTGGCLLYRVLEVPDVGEPFDVRAFVATLPKVDGYTNFSSLVAYANTIVNNIELELEADGNTRDYRPDLSSQNQSECQLLKQDPRIEGYLDRLFEKNAEVWREAAVLPLGLVGFSERIPFTHESLGLDARGLIFAIRLRNCQLEDRGDLKGTLELFATVLGIARQLEDNAPSASSFGQASNWKR